MGASSLKRWPNYTRRYAAILILGVPLLAGGRAAAQSLVTDLQNSDTIRQLDQLKQQDDQLYKSDQAEKLQRYPLVVFIPGILGSKIEECDRDPTKKVNSNCRFIWGQKEWLESFSTANMSIKPEKFYRTDVLDNFKALGPDTEFYGGGLAFLNEQYVSNHRTLL